MWQVRPPYPTAAFATKSEEFEFKMVNFEKINSSCQQRKPFFYLQVDCFYILVDRRTISSYSPRYSFGEAAGVAAEAQFAAFLKMQKGTFAKAPLPRVEKVLEVATSRHSKKLNSLMNGERCSISELAVRGSAFLMDCIFKCDFLVEYEDINGEMLTLGIDVTTTPRDLLKKEKEINNSLYPSLKELGVARTAVISWNRNDFLDMTLADSYSIAGVIMDRLDSNDLFCNSIILDKGCLEQRKNLRHYIKSFVVIRG